MIIVYSLKHSVNDEILYSLRSLALNLKCEFKVVIYANYKVEGLKNIEFRQVAEHGDTQQKQGLIYQDIIKSKIKDFYFMNDDIYLLKPIDFIQLYYRSSCVTKFQNSWVGKLNATLHYLSSNNKPFIDYETHTPYLINSEKLSSLKEVLSGEHLLATRFYNEFNYDIKRHCKMDKLSVFSERKINISNAIWLNNDDAGLSSVMPILKDKFPNKCLFEC